MIQTSNNNLRLPQEFKKKISIINKKNTLKILRKYSLNSVCEESHCPNIDECFLKKTATFMILGKKCTRRCNFCLIKTGKGEKVNISEPLNIVKAINKMELNHVVITSVDRDDLLDYGASHFVKCIQEIKIHFPNITIEILTPDFNGNIKYIAKLINAKPDVFVHNIETVKKIFQKVRPQSKWKHTCSLLKQVGSAKNIILKSGIMVGLGENDCEVEETLYLLRDLGVKIVTIGQYLRPSLKHWPVKRYVSKEIYNKWEKLGKKLGLKIIAGAFVRSSYKAKEILQSL